MRGWSAFGYYGLVFIGPLALVFAFMTGSMSLLVEQTNDARFFRPVSNCYAEDAGAIWRWCHCVVKRGGGLLEAGFTLAGLYVGINGAGQLRWLEHTDMRRDQIGEGLRPIAEKVTSVSPLLHVNFM